MSFQPTYKRSIQLASVVALGILFTGCSASKVSQCNKLIQVANQAVSSVQAVTQPGTTPDNVAAMSKIAAAADQAKTDMDALQLTDEKLSSFKSRFVSMYSATSKATKDLVTAANAKKTAEAQQAFNDLKTATDQEGPLVNEINVYCSNK